MKSLKKLDLSRNCIEKEGGKWFNCIDEIEGLDNLENLEEIDLYGNEIEKIENLEKLKNLKDLDLSRNLIKKVENLQGIKNLEILDLGHNPIKKVENLDGLDNLETLYLSDSSITDLHGLSKLKNLKKLGLYGNKLKQLEGIENLRNLEWLNLDVNQLTELSGLEHLDKMKELRLSDNFIEHIGDALDRLGVLETIDLSKNPLKSRSDVLASISSSDIKYIYVGKTETRFKETVPKIFRRNYERNLKFDEYSFSGSSTNWLDTYRPKIKVKWKVRDSKDYWKKISIERDLDRENFKELIGSGFFKETYRYNN